MEGMQGMRRRREEGGVLHLEQRRREGRTFEGGMNKVRDAFHMFRIISLDGNDTWNLRVVGGGARARARAMGNLIKSRLGQFAHNEFNS